jgi:hypothetical protein
MTGFKSFGYFGVFPGTGGVTLPPPPPPAAGVYWDPGYWDARYYDPSWFPGVAGAAVAAVAGGRDYTVALAIKDLLEGATLDGATAFERVEVGVQADNFKLRAGDNPVVLITLVNDSDQNWDTKYWLHRVTFGLVFATLANEPSTHSDNLDRLRNLAANLITTDGSLGGLCIPGFTVFTRGDHQTTPSSPEHRLTATVDCAYAVPRTAGRDVTAVA